MTEKAVKSLNMFCERVAELEGLGYQVLSYEPHPAGGYDFMVIPPSRQRQNSRSCFIRARDGDGGDVPRFLGHDGVA